LGAGPVRLFGTVWLIGALWSVGAFRIVVVTTTTIAVAIIWIIVANIDTVVD